MNAPSYATTCENKKRFTSNKVKRTSQYWYLCPYCGWYHGTSVKPPPWQQGRPELRGYRLNHHDAVTIYKAYKENGAIYLQIVYQNDRYEIVATRSY